MVYVALFGAVSARRRPDRAHPNDSVLRQSSPCWHILATKAAPLGGRRFTPFAVFLRRQHAGQSTVVFEICSECFHHLRYFYEGSTDQCTGVFEICRFSFHEECRQHCIQTDSTIQTALSLECRAPPRSRDGRRRKNALALDVDSMNASILFVNFLT